MNSDISKKIDVLFHPTHLPLQFKSSQPKAIQALDNKISLIALKAIRNITAALVCAAAISLVIGSVAAWPAALTIGILAATAIGIEIILRKSKWYHIPSKLQEHKKEAASLVLTYKYLDKHAQINEEIKKDIIHPVKALFSKHPNIEKFFKYEILDPSSFKEALELELNYSKFDDSLFLVKLLIAKTKNPLYIQAIQDCKPILNAQLAQLIQKKHGEFDEINTSKKEDFRDFYNFKKELKIFIKQIERAYSCPLIEGKRDVILDKIKTLKKHLEKFEKKSKETESAHQKWDKELLDVIQESNADYSSLSQHYNLSAAKNDFIHHLNIVQQSSEGKKKEKMEAHQIFIEGLKEFTPTEKEQLEKFYKQKLNVEFGFIDEETKLHIENLATRITSDEISELTKQIEQAHSRKEENLEIMKKRINEKYEGNLPNKTKYCDFSSDITDTYKLVKSLLETASYSK